MTEISAADPTRVVSVSLLLAGLGSAVAAETVAVLLIVPVVEGAIATVSVKTALPTARLGFVQVMVPPAPTAGVVHDQPPGEESATNVVARRQRVREADASRDARAGIGHRDGVGDVDATHRRVEGIRLGHRESAEAASVSVSVAELLPGVGSVTPAGAVTVAVLESVPVAAAETAQLAV